MKQNRYVEICESLIIRRIIDHKDGYVLYLSKKDLKEEILRKYDFPENQYIEYLRQALKSLRGQALIYWENSFENSDLYKIILNESYFDEERKVRDLINTKTVLNNLINDTVGIYCIFNKENGRRYIGSSIKVKNRIVQHFDKLENNNHHNYRLQKDYEYFGKDAFQMFLLEEVNTISDLPSLEYSWINRLGELYSSVTYNISNPLEEYEVIEERNKYSKNDNIL